MLLIQTIEQIIDIKSPWWKSVCVYFDSITKRITDYNNMWNIYNVVLNPIDRRYTYLQAHEVKIVMITHDVIIHVNLHVP